MNNMPNINPFQYGLPNFIDKGIDDISNFENRIHSLEKEIVNVKNRLSKLENINKNYSNNYQPNSYNMM